MMYLAYSLGGFKQALENVANGLEKEGSEGRTATMKILSNRLGTNCRPNLSTRRPPNLETPSLCWRKKTVQIYGLNPNKKDHQQITMDVHEHIQTATICLCGELQQCASSHEHHMQLFVSQKLRLTSMASQFTPLQGQVGGSDAAREVRVRRRVGS